MKLVVEKIKTHILCSVTLLPKWSSLWDNVENILVRQATDDIMVHTHCMLVTKATDDSMVYTHCMLVTKATDDSMVICTACW